MLDQSKTYAYDSRKINAGDAFICLPKGETYIEEALMKGATEVIHFDRQAFALNANAYFSDPTKRVKLVGITGTNGKTSVATFTEQLLKKMGHKVLVIGTINSQLTTPESWDTLKKIKDHADNGGTHVVLEVSSHGIDQSRVFGFNFDVKCLTNITQDHLDYHKTFEHYQQTKLHFMEAYPGHSVFTDDVTLIDPVEIPQLKGSFHIKNVSSALAICKLLGEDANTLTPYLSQLIAPKGRFESVDAGQSFGVIVDFAHTQDALEHVCRDALNMVSGNKDRLRLVFGCGGDRDQDKRSKMGAVADTYCGHVYLTADNSRSEPTLDIIHDIKSGMNESAIEMIAPNRKDAIGSAIAHAKPNDVILIAGKGHETMQHCNGFSYVFNDYDMAFSEIIRRHKFQVEQQWVLNQPDANADVLFISKKMMPLLKITYSQFKRAIPTPSNAKIKDYLAKLNGPKIIVFENNRRCSIADTFLRLLNDLGGGVEFSFNEKESLEHNLVGLTLIEQTEHPIVIRINPNDVGSIQKVMDIISPNHVMVGDIYDNHGFIEPTVSKAIASLGKGNSTIWIHQQMVDIIDQLPPDAINHQQVSAPSWMEYIQTLIESVLHALDLPLDQSRDIILRQLIAIGWVTKVNFENIGAALYVMDWTQDLEDAKQKMSFFQQNSDCIVHHVMTTKQSQLLMDELSRRHQHVNAQVIIINNNDGMKNKVSSIKDAMLSHEKAVHILWKSPSDLLGLLEYVC